MRTFGRRLLEFSRRRRIPLTIVGSVAVAALLAAVLAGRRAEFTDALSRVSLAVLAGTALLQVVALVSRSEAWHLTIEAAGGTVSRRVLYRASSMQVLGGVLNGHLGVAARIAALRRSSPDTCPQVPTLVAAEFPILAIEAMLAAAASFTLVVPLGLPWWLPLIALAVVGLVSAALRQLALRKGRELWRGLAVLRSFAGGSRVVGFVLVAVVAQILRNWILLRAVGVDASLLDATAVLIAVVTLGQLPVGPTVGAAAAVLILGHDGVAAAAAGGLLLTVTGTIGGLCFVVWAGLDHVVSAARAVRSRPAPRPESSAG
ncbi:MAG TPA: hypothetical protein VM824_10765 [Thermoleophilaceae bacterium]|nr:hypothetical protein [Thermoleophilaceae bacterium]